jgi:O-antigen/teichoic acid export membrane protein
MPLLLRFVLTMVGLVLLVTITVAVVGHPVLQFLVGPAWRTDTGFLILALLPVLWRVIASPVSSILILTDDITTLGIWQFTQFLVTAIILFGFVHSLGFEWTLGALAISDFIMYGAYLFLSIRAARRSSHAR